MSVTEAPHTTDFTVPSWAPAEFLDTPFDDETVLRATICQLGASRWQWTIMSMGKNHGELISSGIERGVSAARQAAASEIEKCLQDPLASE